MRATAENPRVAGLMGVRPDTVISATFIITLGWEAFTLATIGLIVGGLMAAPFGAVLAKRVPAKQLLYLVGTVLTLTSLFSLSKALGLV
jgi:uncharacterized membrane protein YfcA